MYIVTGGAGFIGSCVVRAMNDMGVGDISIVDNVSDTEKWMNLRGKTYVDYIHKDAFLERLDSMRDVTAVIHLGACSSTTESNFDYLWNNNFEYTKTLWEYCARNEIPFIYASSAATYGDGRYGFDDRTDIDELMPMNAYGYSKQLFDQWVKRQALSSPPQHVGLKFFNVYGPNEYHKGRMASMVFHGYRQLMKDGEIRLFKSYNPMYGDGEQSRDFVYVKDICNVITWLLEHGNVSGLFNVGTGVARSFNDLATAITDALQLEPSIRYIDMPNDLIEKYQYFTCAEMSSLRDAGYSLPFTSLEDGVRDYVQQHLEKHFEIY